MSQPSLLNSSRVIHFFSIYFQKTDEQTKGQVDFSNYRVASPLLEEYEIMYEEMNRQVERRKDEKRWIISGALNRKLRF